jgi:DnaJ-class molecular chaperone
MINQYQTCPQCKGKGACPRMMQMGPGMMMQTSVPCTKCKTTGEILPTNIPVCIEKDCHKGLQTRTVKHSFEIKKGMDYGPQLLKNKGDFLKSPNHRADIILDIHPSTSNYTRQGFDLIREETIALGESLLGFDYHVDHVDGERKIRLHSSKVIAPETVKCLPGQGLPTANTPSKFGDLYIIFKVKFPDSDAITPKTKKALDQIMKRRQTTPQKNSIRLDLDEATEKSPSAPSSTRHNRRSNRPQNVECAQQ